MARLLLPKSFPRALLRTPVGQARTFATTPRWLGPLTDELVSDHHEMFTYMDKVLEATDPLDKERWANQLVWQVTRHLVAEEMYLYPLMEKRMDVAKAKEMTDRDRLQDEEIKRRIIGLEEMKASQNPAAFDAQLRSIYSLLKEHIQDEESKDLPAIEALLTPKESQDAARMIKRIKSVAPTRTHRGMPDSSDFKEGAAALFAMPVDRLHDLFLRFPDQEAIDQAKSEHSKAADA